MHLFFTRLGVPFSDLLVAKVQSLNLNNFQSQDGLDLLHGSFWVHPVKLSLLLNLCGHTHHWEVKIALETADQIRTPLNYTDQCSI